MRNTLLVISQNTTFFDNMKLLIAFALFAVALADEIRVVPLPEVPAPILSRVSMGQLIVPNYIIDAVKIGMPVMRDELMVADDDSFKVNFVDGPVEAVLFVDGPEPLILGEAPLPAFETVEIDAVRIAEPSLPEVAPLAEEIAPEPVHFVDAPLAEEIAPEPVHFVDAPLPAVEDVELNAVKIAEPSLPEVAPLAEEIVPETVHFVDAPIAEEIAPEPVHFVDAPLPAVEDVEVYAVKIAEPSLPEVAPLAEEIVPEPVHFVDAPLAEEIASEPVHFVDAPLPAVEDVEVSAVKIAEPILPEVAPLAEEIVPEPVHFVDAPLPAVEDVEVSAVKIAEPSLPEVAPLAEEIAPEPVHFVDAPLEAPVSISLPEPALPAFETVEAIEIAEPQFSDYRGKQFNDPRLR